MTDLQSPFERGISKKMTCLRGLEAARPKLIFVFLLQMVFINILIFTNIYIKKKFWPEASVVDNGRHEAEINFSRAASWL